MDIDYPSSPPTEPGTGVPRSSSPTEPGTGPPPEIDHTDNDSGTETGSTHTVTGTTTDPTTTKPQFNLTPTTLTTNNPNAAPLSTILQIKEELISQVLTSWVAQQYPIPDPAVAAEMAAMSWDFDSLPAEGPGCMMKLTRTKEGEYVYIPYDDSLDGMEDAMVERVKRMEEWMRSPENVEAIRKLDRELEREVDESCFWELLQQGESAERVDLSGKVSSTQEYTASYAFAKFSY